jgi:2,4-dienoyl-CoA reductase-like NADH-dependent reductase (Old Yellow Enzyme family)
MNDDRTRSRSGAISVLFQPSAIRNMRLANRFVRSATWEGLADEEGLATPELAALYGDLARGRVGLIISSHAFVSPEGRAGSQQLGAHDDSMAPGLERLAATVHEAGGKLALQIAHAGLWAAPATTRTGTVPGASAAPETGAQAADSSAVLRPAAEPADPPQPLGPSVRETDSGPVGREMSPAEIAAVTEAFAEAARRAREAGFDAVQIHAAHGYLLSEFLSPFFNRRSDAYGGSVPKRARLVCEVVRAVRTVVGPDYPVLIKLNSEDFVPGGLSVDQMLESAVLIAEAGVDAIELSGGTSLSGDQGPIRTRGGIPEDREAYYEEASLKLKQKVSIPVMLVGGIRSFEVSERLLTQGYADYVAFSRPFICEPGLVARWQGGDRAASTCRSDNRCYYKGLKREGMYCVHTGRGPGEGR